MKQGKRLTYQVKRIISAMGLDVNDWLIKVSYHAPKGTWLAEATS